MANGDLIIVDDQKNAFLVLKTDWNVDGNRIDNGVVGDAAVVVKRGALIADIPEPDIPVGYYCYLINLAQLRVPVAGGKGTPKASGPEGLGQDGLIIHTSDDAYFILTATQWQKTPYTGPVDVKETICADTAKGFVVNLPLFTTA